MRQNGIFYSGDKFHPFPLRSIDFFQIPCDTENFLFQKLLLLKKFFTPEKFHDFFRKYFCVFLNLFLAYRLRLNFWFFLRTRDIGKTAATAGQRERQLNFPANIYSRKKAPRSIRKETARQSKTSHPTSPTRNAKFCQNSYDRFRLWLYVDLSDWKIKKRVLWNRFACAWIWIWNRTLNFFPPCRKRVSRDARLTRPGIYIGKYKRQRTRSFASYLKSYWKTALPLEIEKRWWNFACRSGRNRFEIIHASHSGLCLVAAWVTIGAHSGRVWAAVVWLGHIWFALEMMRLECIRITLGSRLSCVRQHSGSIS